MSTLIPNENCWIGFATDLPASPLLVPTAAECGPVPLAFVSTASWVRPIVQPAGGVTLNV